MVNIKAQLERDLEKERRIWKGMERGTTGKEDRHFSETFFSEHITTGFFWKGGSKRGIAWKGGSTLERERVIWKGGWKGGQLEKGIAIFRKHFFSECHFSICFWLSEFESGIPFSIWGFYTKQDTITSMKKSTFYCFL